MNLNKQDILFIDTYLVNSDAIYADIRQEMLDHIANAVEEKMHLEKEDFYTAFKAYMINNKKEILKNNKQQGSFSWNAVKQFMLFLGKPYLLFLGVILYFLFSNFDINRVFSTNFNFGNLVFLLVLFLMIFQAIYFRIYLKKRFYYVEKTGSVLLIIYFLQSFLLPIYGRENVSTITLTFFTYLLLSYTAFFINEVLKFNKHQYNYI